MTRSPESKENPLALGQLSKRFAFPVETLLRLIWDGTGKARKDKEGVATDVIRAFICREEGCYGGEISYDIHVQIHRVVSQPIHSRGTLA